MRANNILARAGAAALIAALVQPPVLAAPAARHQGAATVQRARVGVPPVSVSKPATEKWLSIGEGELITLPAAVADVWTSNPGVADVYVANPRQLNLFGKDFGESTVFATDRAGNVVYSATVRVAQNSTSLDRMLAAAMPGADIKVTRVGQIAVINGTVASPDDSAQVQQLVTGLLNPGADPTKTDGLKIGIVNRLRTATPLQVNLQVKFAEVSRSFLKNISSNILTRDTTGGFKFGLSSGRNPGTITNADTASLPQLDASARYGFPAGTLKLPFDPKTGQFVLPNSGTDFTFTRNSAVRSSLGLAGKLFGLDVLQAIDLGEQTGQVTTLANPNLTALSGETGTFLAGGELPIPISQGLGTVSVEYKQFGVSLAYTPTVLSDGRISLRVRPEVSQLDYSNAVPIGGTQIPALTTRRAETTVELGSGQSFMIAGLMQNSHYNNFDKTPGVGDVPVLGALFRSNAFQRNETELVIIITPYLVKPANANDIALPTDGYKAPTDLQRVLMGQLTSSQANADRPKPTMETAPAAAPTIGAAANAPVVPQPAPQPVPAQPPVADRKAKADARKSAGTPTPGFSIN